MDSWRDDWHLNRTLSAPRCRRLDIFIGISFAAGWSHSTQRRCLTFPFCEMLRFRRLFPQPCSIIGMVHVPALPGTPRYKGCTERIVESAVKEALIYAESCVDGILLENMHDIPYVKQKDLSPETISMMTRICTEVRKIAPLNIACGIQILAGCNKEAIAVAKAARLQFIRAEGFVFSHMADEGFIDANAGTLLRYRRQIDAEEILVFADVKKKHSSHAITSDVSLVETVKAAQFFLADGIILTGNATGQEVNMKDLTEVRECVAARVPVLIGSGVTLDNVDNYAEVADALIVGSHFKTAGRWENPLNPERTREASLRNPFHPARSFTLSNYIPDIVLRSTPTKLTLSFLCSPSHPGACVSPYPQILLRLEHRGPPASQQSKSADGEQLLPRLLKRDIA
ncbi:hypothetical protein HN011_009149 [Eciton burchellii]|nr:hypothetical protein HN011_009149 [Eciton burchellii]